MIVLSMLMIVVVVVVCLKCINYCKIVVHADVSLAFINNCCRHLFASFYLSPLSLSLDECAGVFFVSH